MRLTPREMDRIVVFCVAEMARRRKGKGLKLNYPESVALICDEVSELARMGKSYDEVLTTATRILTRDDVLDGVPELASSITVEVSFPEGTKLLVLNDPIR